MYLVNTVQTLHLAKKNRTTAKLKGVEQALLHDGWRDKSPCTATRRIN